MGERIALRAPETSAEEPGSIKVVKWLVADGARVRANAAVVEVETDKAEIEVEAPEAGRLVQLVPAGAQVSHDAVLGEIDTRGSSADAGQRTVCEFCETIYVLSNTAASTCPNCGAPPKGKRAQ